MARRRAPEKSGKRPRSRKRLRRGPEPKTGPALENAEKRLRSPEKAEKSPQKAQRGPEAKTQNRAQEAHLEVQKPRKGPKRLRGPEKAEEV